MPDEPQSFANVYSRVWALDPASGLLLQSAAALIAQGGAEGSRGVIERIPGVQAAIAGGVARGDNLYQRIGSVAAVNISGILDKSDADTGVVIDGTSYVWGTSYESILRAVKTAIADDQVGSILLRINSPGGAAIPTEPAADELYQLRQAGKPIVAMADDMAASAALFIATQASEFYLTPSGYVGSIGTILLAPDFSGALEREGIKVNVIKSTPSKDTGNPYRPMNDADRKMLQDEVDTLAGKFIAAVARGRDMSEQTVRDLAVQRVYLGQRAVDVGLADGVRTNVETLIDELSQKHPAAGSSTGSTSGRAQMNHGTVLSMPASVAGSNPAHSMTAVHAACAGSPVSAVFTSPKHEDQAMPDETKNATQTEATKATAKPNEQQTSPQATEAVTLAERNRTRAIMDAAFPYRDTVEIVELRDQAILDGSSIDEFRAQAMEKLAKIHKPTGHVPSGAIAAGEDNRARETQAIELSLTARMNPDAITAINDGGERGERVARAMGFDGANAARSTLREAESAGIRGRRMEDVARMCIARANGISFDQVHRQFDTPEKIMGAAFHSTSDFPLILANTANKAMLARFQEIDVIWTSICRRGVSTDYKDSYLLSLSEAPNLELIPEGGTPSEGSFNERRESVQVAPYGKRFSYTYQMLRNDDLGAFGQFSTLFGESSRRLPDDALVTLLAANSKAGPTMSDSKALFHADHNNLGSAAALGYASAWAGWKAMRSQKGFGPNTAPINVVPQVLLVPTALYDVALDLETQEYAPTGDANDPNKRNTLRGRFTAKDSPRIDDSIDATSWWWFASPSTHPAFEVRFLDGQDMPEITPIDDGDPMSRRFQATVRGFGLAAVQYESAYRNPGA